MEPCSTRSRASSRRCSDTVRQASAAGFTLAEIMVSLAITLALMAAGLAVALSSRKALVTDQERTHVNQNLRSGMDLLGFDLRQAGEQLPKDMPAILVQDGASGAPDTLVVRRNLNEHVLPVCQTITSGSSASTIAVADAVSSPAPPGCAPLPDDNADGWPDNMESWRDQRVGAGGSVMAYIYNPTTKLGEFFVYDGDDNASYTLSKGNLDNWVNDYSAADQARIYILEERTFTLNGDIVQYTVNGLSGSEMSLVSDVIDLQIMNFFQSKPAQATLGPADDWTDLQSIQVTLTGEPLVGAGGTTRTLVSRFYPRNAQSG